MSDLYKRSILKAYDEAMLTEPKHFLSGFFDTEKQYNGRTVEWDVMRSGKEVAIAVAPGKGANLNQIGAFTNKRLTAPYYSEYHAVTADEMFDRQFGKSPYEESSGVEAAMAKVLRGQLECSRKISRTLELQASSILFGGTLTLTHHLEGELTFDFKAKAAHHATAAVAWSTVTADALGEVATQCGLVSTNGKTKPTAAVFGETAWANFLKNTAVKEVLNSRRMDHGSIGIPQWETSGAVYQGHMTFGSYNLSMWTYPEKYDLSGTPTSYVPATKVLVLDPSAYMVTAYGAIPTWGHLNKKIGSLYGLPSLPMLTKGKIEPYYFLDKKHYSIEAGAHARFMLVPVAIDTYATLDTAGP